MIKGMIPCREPSLTLGQQLGRQLWNVVHALIFRTSPRPFHAWRVQLLRLFGAQVGEGCYVYPSVSVWAPWNLQLGNFVCVGDGVTLYCVDRIEIGDYAVISQGAHLCCGTHDYNSANFQLMIKPIVIGARAWVCAEAFIHPGVAVSEGAVVGARAVVTRSLSTPWAVYAKNPAIQVGKRVIVTNVSVLILTKNEQQDLPGCLQNVSWSDDVHVYDSGSTDDTVAIAQSFGAKVTVRTYGENKLAFGGNEAAHRNWGLQNIPFKHPWVFVIDADERMTPDLVWAVNAAVASQGDQVAFRIQRRDFFLGTWLKHVQTSPFYMRLIRPEKVKHERLINTVSVAEGPIGQVTGYLDHFPFSKGISHWLDRHNGYSRFEAQQIMGNRQANEGFSWVKALTAKDFHQRRYHQKELFYRLPFRPLVKFMLLYVAKCGFMDGEAGFTYAVLQSVYEYFIVLKVRELQVAAQETEDASPQSASL